MQGTTARKAADIIISSADESDFAAIWPMFEKVVSSGDTYVYDPKTTYEQGKAIWFSPDRVVYKAERDGVVVGSYHIRPNQPGLGSHIANAGFMVEPDARSGGIGRLMGEHSLAEAKRLGYKAMQFNAVISTNTRAVALWKSLGFEIIATIPQGYQHASQGLVDSYIMFRKL